MNTGAPLIDEKSALDALNGDRQLLSELALIFVEDTPDLLENLQNAIAKRDFRTACRTIHGLRGLVSTFYADEVTSLASKLEHDLQRGSVELVENGEMDELKASLAKLVQELRDSGYVQ